MKINSNSNNHNYNLAILAIVAALALLGVVMVLVANNLAVQEAEAGCPLSSPAPNASKGRCFRG